MDFATGFPYRGGGGGRAGGRRDAISDGRARDRRIADPALMKYANEETRPFVRSKERQRQEGNKTSDNESYLTGKQETKANLRRFFPNIKES